MAASKAHGCGMAQGTRRPDRRTSRIGLAAQIAQFQLLHTLWNRIGTQSLCAEARGLGTLNGALKLWALLRHAALRRGVGVGVVGVGAGAGGRG